MTTSPGYWDCSSTAHIHYHKQCKLISLDRGTQLISQEIHLAKVNRLIKATLKGELESGLLLPLLTLTSVQGPRPSLSSCLSNILPLLLPTYYLLDDNGLTHTCASAAWPLRVATFLNYTEAQHGPCAKL